MTSGHYDPETGSWVEWADLDHGPVLPSDRPDTRTKSGQVLDDVVRFVRRFVVLSDAQADAVALWVAHTHAVEAAESTPYLGVTSALKRCGKSRLREVLELVVRQPLPASNISDAALFRTIDKLTPTLLLDEADAIFKAREREDLRGMLNAGYRRGAVAYRMGGANKTTLESFPVFCAKAFFGIGDFLPDTLSDRAIHIRLERRLREERIERFTRREVEPEGHELRERLADWLEPQIEELRRARPELPGELDDRAQDSWEPLLAIADQAGGDWPTRALAAAVPLSTGEEREDNSTTARLLADIFEVFDSTGLEAFKTTDLLEHLHAIEEAPWGEWYGKPLSSHALSKLLRPHRIKTMSVYVGDGVSARGYKLGQFADAFARVLGDRSDRSDRSGSLSNEASNASVASVASTRKEEDDARSLDEALRDPAYVESLADLMVEVDPTTKKCPTCTARVPVEDEQCGVCEKHIAPAPPGWPM